MKKLSLIALIALFVFGGNAFSAKGEHIKEAKITMRCGGKTYTATTDQKGKFTIKDYDCDDSYTFSVDAPPTGKSSSTEVLSWSWGASQSGTFHQGSGAGSGKVNVQDISMTKSSARDAASGQATGKRDAASGQATGKRQHKPITVKHTLCPSGGRDNDCDGTVDRCVLEITYDGNNIQGMAINEKGLPGEKKPKKSNK